MTANVTDWAALTHDDLSHGPIQNVAYWLNQIGYQATSSSLVFNLLSYGAKVDGVTDDSAAWKAAIAAAAAAGGGVIHMPGGVSMVKPAAAPNGVSIQANNITIQGAGRDASIIRCTPTGAATLMHIQGTQPGGAGTTIFPVVNTHIFDLTLDGNGSTLAGSGTCGLQWVYDCMFRNVRFTNVNGARLLGMTPQNNLIENWRIHFEDCLFDNFQNQNHIEAAEITGTQTCTFRRCEFTNIEYACLSFYTFNRGMLVDDCWFHDGYPASAHGPFCHGIIWKQSDTGLTVSNSTFERLWGGNAMVDGGGPGSPDNFGFLNPRKFIFTGNYVRDCNKGVELLGPWGFEISDSTFEYLQSEAITYASSNVPRHGQVTNNTIRNCGMAQLGGDTQCGVSLHAATANTYDSDVLWLNNHFEDDQPTQTMLAGFLLDSGSAVNGMTFEHNDLSRMQSPVQIVSGSWGPSTVFRNNPGYNQSVAVSAPTLSATGIATLNKTNFDLDMYLTAGTVSAVAVGACAEPTLAPNVLDVTGGGSGFTTGASTMKMSFNLVVGGTSTGPVGNFTIANATDSLVVSALPTPTQNVTMTTQVKNTSLPGGTYRVAYSLYNDVGETAALTLSPDITIVTGGQITVPQINNITGMLGAKFYFIGSSPLLGLVDQVPVNSALNVASFVINQIPFAVPAPTVAPSVTNPAAAGTYNSGATTFTCTYVTPCGIETIAGPASGSVNVVANTALQVGPFNLDSSVQVALGQIGVARVRVYASGANTGMVADLPVNLPALAGGACTVSAYTSFGVLSAQGAPTVDQSIPKTNSTRTDGWTLPTGVTGANFWLTTGGTTWLNKSGDPAVGGFVYPYVSTAPGVVTAAPTVNNSGTQIASGTPVQFNLPAGTNYVVTHTGAPTQKAIAH